MLNCVHIISGYLGQNATSVCAPLAKMILWCEPRIRSFIWNASVVWLAKSSWFLEMNLLSETMDYFVGKTTKKAITILTTISTTIIIEKTRSRTITLFSTTIHPTVRKTTQKVMMTKPHFGIPQHTSMTHTVRSKNDRNSAIKDVCTKVVAWLLQKS